MKIVNKNRTFSRTTYGWVVGANAQDTSKSQLKQTCGCVIVTAVGQSLYYGYSVVTKAVVLYAEDFVEFSFVLANGRLSDNAMWLRQHIHTTKRMLLQVSCLHYEVNVTSQQSPGFLLKISAREILNK